MNRYISILLIFLFVLTAPSIVSAEDEERYAATITNELGLELRILQLERSIDTRLVLMTETLTEVNDTELEETTALLVELRDEVRESTNTRELFTESRVLAQEYITSFRERLDELEVEEQVRAQIRQSAQAEMQNVRREYQERTRELATSYNKNRARQLAERAGANADEVANEITSDMSREDVASLVRERMGEQRSAIAMQIREERQENIAMQRERAQEIRDTAQEIREERRSQIGESVRDLVRRARERPGMSERPINPPGLQLTFNNLDYRYNGTTLQYEVGVTSPNQCYEIDTEASLQGPRNPTLRINIESEQVSEECPQVITMLSSEGTVDVPNLAQVNVFLYGERVYASSIASTDAPNTPQERDEDSDENLDEDERPRDSEEAVREQSQIRGDTLQASYRGTTLSVEGEAVLPSTCFEVETEADLENGVLEVYRFQARDICKDVIDVVDFSASVETNNPPTTISVNNEVVRVSGVDEGVTYNE